MSIKINYLKLSNSKSTANQLLFCNEKFNISSLKKYLSNSEHSYINDLLKTSDLKKSLLVFELTSKKKIIFISIKKNLKSSDIENLGAELYGRINYGKNTEYFVISDSILSKYENFLSHLLHGLKLKSYQFDKYKSKKESRIITLNVMAIKTNLPIKSGKI